MGRIEELRAKLLARHEALKPDPAVKQFVDLLNAHLEAQKAGVAIHTMTLGAEADRKLLKRIAEETGGSYATESGTVDARACGGAVAVHAVCTCT